MKGWSYVRVLIPFLIIGIIGVLRYTKEMDILTFGEEQAKAVGVDTNRVKRHLFIHSAILTGSAVALSGTIGFVDLIAPHMVRRVFGSKHKYVIPMSFVFGGSLMVITDLIARTIVSPAELPVGAITAIIGDHSLHMCILAKERSDDMLEVKNLYCGYEDVDVIKNVNFKVERGKNLCIVGPNGCGKSTLLKSIANIINYKGSITIDGMEVCNFSRKNLAKKIGLMSQITQIYFHIQYMKL